MPAPGRPVLPHGEGAETIDASALLVIMRVAGTNDPAPSGEVAQWQSRGLISPWLMVQIHSSPLTLIMTNNFANCGKLLVIFLFVANGFWP